jgi:transmembrane sensor
MTPRPSEVTRQAAEWVVQLRAPDAPADCEAQFTAWLCASPLHVREYLAAVEVWHCLADPSMEPGSSREALIEDAGTSGVIDFPSPADSRAPASGRHSPQQSCWS